MPAERRQGSCSARGDVPQAMPLVPQSGHPLGVKHGRIVCPDQDKPAAANRRGGVYRSVYRPCIGQRGNRKRLRDNRGAAFAEDGHPPGTAGINSSETSEGLWSLRWSQTFWGLSPGLLVAWVALCRNVFGCVNVVVPQSASDAFGGDDDHDPQHEGDDGVERGDGQA